MEAGRIRIQGDCLAIKLDCLTVVARVVVYHSEVIGGFRILSIVLNRALKHVLGFAEVHHLELRDAFLVV